MNDDGIRCRCYGVDRRTRCENDATQEDGLCDVCRCRHGGCDQHGDDATFRPDLWYEEPMTWVAWFQQAQAEMIQCKGIRIYEEVKEDELRDREDVQEQEGVEGGS
jgi:hypothetical protein